MPPLAKVSTVATRQEGVSGVGARDFTVLVRLINELLGLEARLGEAPLPSYLLRLSGCHNSGVQR